MAVARRGSGRSFSTRLGTAVVAIAALLAAVLVPTGAAVAAGPGVLTVTVTPVDYASGDVQSQAGTGLHGDRVAYEVVYSCAVAACENVMVQLAPPQTDPNGLAAQNPFAGARETLLRYSTWTPPAAGGTIGGTDATGKTVSLGTVPAGNGGSFQVVYDWRDTGTANVVWAAQFYPNNFAILNSATISSDTATGSVTAEAAPVLWQNTLPSPAIRRSIPATAAPDTELTYWLGFGTGALISAGSGRIAGFANLQAAGGYYVVEQLPAQAEYVSSTLGGEYDAGTHSVIWHVGYDEAGTYGPPSAAAGPGWGAATFSGWSQGTNNTEIRNRSVTVTFPADRFPAADEDRCNFEAGVDFHADAEVTYLDSESTEKYAAVDSAVTVACWNPFGRSTIAKDTTYDATVSGMRNVDVPPDVSGMTCPPSGRDDWGRACTPGAPLPVFAATSEYWTVTARNAGNVPGVATIVDEDLDQADVPVYRIQTSAAATVEYVYKCATGPEVVGSFTGTNFALSAAQQTDGCRFTSASVVSGSIAAGNLRPTGTSAGTAFSVYFYYTLRPGAPVDVVRTNTASGTMTYPDTDLADIQLDSVSRSVRLRALPKVTLATGILATTTAPAVAGGGQAVPGSRVTFQVGGTTSNVPLNVGFTPQYVFIAPVGWEIESGSASFAAGTVPAGVGFDYRTVTIDGVQRQAVIATWPTPQTFGRNGAWPPMSVVASPTSAVAAGTTSVYGAWAGDSQHTWTNTEATFGGARLDDIDVDDDGVDTEWFATTTGSILVSSAHGMSVLKEICRPDGSPDDGCEWLGDPAQAVPVSTTASDIRYRITIRNTGNTTLTNVVGYDVLPHVGDFGTSDASAGTPRNSMFDETLNDVDAVSSNLSLTFSDSMQPYRPEVYSGANTVNDWGSAFAGAQAIRAEVIGSLVPGAAVSFEYAASVGAGAAADAIACNSVAVNSTQLGVLEPPAVCATTAEADLAVTLPATLPLQAGRPGLLPFTVVNNGGSANAPGTVEIAVPSGLSVTSLTPEGWTCEAPGALPIAGPVTLDCLPAAPLARDTPVSLELPVLVGSAATDLCIEGEISGIMHDPVLDNNETSSCFAVSAEGGLIVGKDDGLTVVRAGGAPYTYTIEVSNTLVAEALSGVSVNDELPAGLVFVSASDDGTVTGQLPDGSGGTVTWPAASLSAAGTGAAPADGAVLTRTVTVRALPNASGEIENLARASAPDPAGGDALEDEGVDVDALQRLTVTKASDAPAAGVRTADTIRYTVTLTNSGTADYTAADPAVLVDDLLDVLDDATFVAGSASVSIAGGSAQPVADPVAGRLAWSGALASGDAVVLIYDVTVGDSAAGDRILANTAFAAEDPTVCADGFDADGRSCATVSTGFAPVLDKRLASLDQGDDGRWTIVYDIDVTNLNPAEPTTYSLTDALAFGTGITVDSAAVTTAPPGIVTAWDGSGTVASAVPLAADAVHSYQITVVADAGTVAGTGAALCNEGVAGGFANGAVLRVTGAVDETAWGCASPVAPTVEKTVAAPTQNLDGSWNVVYTITVTNPNQGPASSLAYRLADQFDVPSGVTVEGIQVVGPTGAAVNPDFDGLDDTALLTGVDRVPAAASASIPSVRAYSVTATTEVPAGSIELEDLACAPAGEGGYANEVTLFAGTSATVLDSSSACANIEPRPAPEIAKSVVQTSVEAGTGYWTIEYEVLVSNPDERFSTVYDLQDQLQFAAGTSIVDATVTSDDVAPAFAWDGVNESRIVADQPLSAATTHAYRIVVRVDPSELDTESAAADCRLDSDEIGTGYRNLATVVSGGASQFAAACEPATDPSVVKTVVGSPVQDPATGLWTVEYEIAVTNRSTTSAPGGIPYALQDSLEFPAGVEVLEVEVTGENGTINASFDGGADTELASGAIGAAVDDATPARHEYRVTVTLSIVPGTVDEAACDPAQGAGGLRNEVTIGVGARTSGAVACADGPEVPVPGIDKEVLSQRQLDDGTWEVLYRIAVGNPSSTVASQYDLNDAFAFGAGIELAAAPTIVAAPTGVDVQHATWNGSSSTMIAEGVLLPAAGAHSYTVRAIVDTGSVRGSDTAGDCTLDAGEPGTGMRNVATVGGGTEDREAVACATAYEPGITKSMRGAPVQQPDGSWLLSYTVTVANPSAVPLAYGLDDELSLPTDTAVTVQSVTGRDTAPVPSAGWNGGSDTVLVPTGAALPASAVHVFDIVIRATLPAEQLSASGGWGNTATVRSSTDGAVSDDATSTADILVPVLRVEKTADAPVVPRIGDLVSYTVTVTNTGEGDFTGLFPAVVWDSLAGVLDDADLEGAVAVTPATAGVVSAYAEGIRWAGPLGANDQVTLKYTVAVTGDGDALLENIAFAGVPLQTDPETPAACDSPTCAATTTGLPALLIEKSADAESTTRGSVVSYTIRITNTGHAGVPAGEPTVVTDDLSGVLAHASYLGDVSATQGDVEVTGASLAWEGGLDMGESVTIRYSVRVGDSATVGAELVNVATADPSLPMLASDGTTHPARSVSTTTPIRELAWTGMSTPLLGLGLVLLLLVLGGGLLVTRRRLLRRS